MFDTKTVAVGATATTIHTSAGFERVRVRVPSAATDPVNVGGVYALAPGSVEEFTLSPGDVLSASTPATGGITVQVAVFAH